MSKISVFKAPITNVTPFKDVTIKDVYTVIKSDKYKDQTERIRQSDHKAGDTLKKTVLDHVCFSCTCTRRNTKNIKSHSGYIAVDIDHLSEVLTERERILNDLPFNPALVFVSPKGKGLKIVFRIDTDTAKHEDYFFSLESFFIQQYNIQIDKACKDIVRACFLCYDPDAIYNSDPTILDQAFIDTFKGSTFEAIQMDDPSEIMQRCKTWLDKKESFVIGNRNAYITHLAGAYNRYGIDRNTALNDLLSYAQSDFKANEITATVESIYNNTTWHGTAKFDESKPYQFVKSEKMEPVHDLPINGFPQQIRDLINTCVEIYRSPRDYWSIDVIAAAALAIGNNLELNTKYNNVPIFWICKVGNVSDGKTEPQKILMKPFSDKDKAEHERYEAERERYDEISAMTKKERENIGIDEKPKNPQFFQYLTKDFTPETLYDIHKINNRGLLIDREELKGYLDDFNRYNKSGEQSNMLSSWSRVSMVYNRKNAIIRIENPFINILGGMQPDVLPDLAKDGRAENGFVQRFCYAFPDNVDIQYYNKEKLPESVYREWESFINDLLKLPHTKLKLTDDAHQLYENWFNKNREIIYHEPSQHMKGAFGKLDIISLRLAIVIKGMKIIYEADYSENISGEIMQSAIDITEYFRATQKKVFARMFKPAATMTKKDAIRWVTENLPGKTQTEIAEFFNTSRSQIKRI
jgi:hypothetical protein